MIVDEIRRDERALDESRLRGSCVAQRIIGVRDDRMLSDVADLGDDHHLHVNNGITSSDFLGWM
jgi:hypothetical protein